MKQVLVFDAWAGGYVFRPDEHEPRFVTSTTAPGEVVAAVVAEVLPILRDDLRFGGAKLGVKYFLPENAERKAWRLKYGRTPWETFENDPPCNGFVLGSAASCIRLKADLEREEAVEALAHECWHVKQFRDFFAGKARLLEDDEAEARAYEYGRSILRMFKSEVAA